MQHVCIVELLISLHLNHLRNWNNNNEVSTFKSRIIIDHLIQISFFILQHNLLQMLEFYCDCLTRYMKHSSFGLTETGTDSIYMVINAETVDQCIKPNDKDRYEKIFLDPVRMTKIKGGFIEDVVLNIML